MAGSRPLGDRASGSRKHRWLRGRRLVLPGAILTQGLALLRNMLVARLLGPEQFGTAAALLLASQFLDAALDSGLNKFVLSDQHGARRSVAATVQYVAIVRGVTASLMILLFAKPLLRFLEIDLDTTAVALLACSPLIVAGFHYDIVRFQKAGHLGFDSTTQVAGEVCGLVVAVTVAFLTASYISVLAGWIARSIAQVTASHLMANRKYEVKLSRYIVARIIRYSTPLLINGPLLFLSVQADRATIAKLLGPADLGVYAAALILVSSPSAVVIRAIGATYLPIISSAKLLPGAFEESKNQIRALAVAGSLLIMTTFSSLGPTAVSLIFGAKYHTSAGVISSIAVIQGMRFARVWPSGISLATGRTTLELISNFLRLAGIPLAVIFVHLGYALEGLLIGVALGEALALGISSFLLSDAAEAPSTLVSLMSLVFVAISCVASAIYSPWIQSIGPLTAFILAIGFVIVPALSAVRRLWSD